MAGVMISVLLMAGCGGSGGNSETTETQSGPPQEVHATLSGQTGPQDLGLLMAERRRFFADAGLYASFASPLTPRRSVSYVLNGTDELGVARLPQVVEAKASGAPLVVAGSLLSRPSVALIWLKRSGIHSVADLAGKTIAVQSIPVQEEFLRAMLSSAGLSLSDVDLIPAGYNLVPALLRGRADAIFGGTENVEGAELEARGAQPVSIRPQNLGAPDYEELVLIVRADKFAADPDLTRKFMAAVTDGVGAAREDPREALEAMENAVGSNPETDRRSARAQVEATLPLLSRSGEIDLERIQDLVDWMAEEGMIEKGFPASKLVEEDTPPG
jgi:putative hydroxymethylpyrimidine transport system substrate-binding protein